MIIDQKLMHPIIIFLWEQTIVWILEIPIPIPENNWQALRMQVIQIKPILLRETIIIRKKLIDLMYNKSIILALIQVSLTTILLFLLITLDILRTIVIHKSRLSNILTQNLIYTVGLTRLLTLTKNWDSRPIIRLHLI